MDVHCIQVELHDGPKLVGPWYASKAAAKGWVRFVRAFYHGLPTRVRTFTREQAKAIQANGGQPKASTP